MEQLRWGVIGVGRAGAARARAIQADPRAHLTCTHRGDRVDGVPQVTLPELLDRVDAVAVCSPDDSHEHYVSAALARALHALVEFPLAPSRDRAHALMRQAGDRVLHVEHIELLSPRLRWLHAHGFTRGRITFTGGIRRGQRSVAHANIARLHQLVALAGLPERVQVLERSEHHLIAQLDDITVAFRHGDLPRATRFESPHLPPEPTHPRGVGLFLQDQLTATARMLDGAPPYVSDDRVLQVLALADTLHGVARGGARPVS